MTSPGRPRKVLRIIARLNTGGPAIHAILLTRGLEGPRFTSRLVTGVVSEGEGDMQYYAAQMNVVPLVLPELGRRVAPLNDLKALLRLCRLMWRERPDIVHTHTMKAGGLGRLAAVLYNCWARLTGGRPVRLVHTFHGHVFHGYFSPFVSRILVLAERVFALATDRIIAISDSIKRDLVERYRICRAEKVSVVPLGLDFGWVESVGEPSGGLRSMFSVAPDAVTVGLVGRLTEIKNHALLLGALPLIGRDNVTALIVGDGELREALEATTHDLGLDERVIFTGWQRDPARIYGELDIVCLTSRNEGTPVALIEAMAAGRPVVAARVGGVPDLMVGEGMPTGGGFELFANGALVPGDDPAALAEAIRYLVDRPDVRQAMGAAGRAAVFARFSRGRLIRDIEAIYEAILGEPGGRERCDR